MLSKHNFIFIGFLLLCNLGFAQELNCDVRITYENLRQTDPAAFRTMEEKIRSFLNETAFTKDAFDEEERINCTFNINILRETGLNQYQAQATIVSTRPVYNSTYETVLLDVIDKDFFFEFDPYAILEYRENEFANNLTSMLAFYAYTIIGLDYDSFEKNGGKEYHDRARQIVQNAQSTPYPGWTQSNTNNGGDLSKFWINNNLTETRYTTFRNNFYEYHRNGLDQLYDDPQESWETITKVATSFANFNQSNRNLPIMYIFFNAKAEEIVEIMEKASPNQQQKVVESCIEVDPTNNKLYKSLLK